MYFFLADSSKTDYNCGSCSKFFIGAFILYKNNVVIDDIYEFSMI